MSSLASGLGFALLDAAAEGAEKASQLGNDEILKYVASSVFLIAGVVILIATLRNSVRKKRRTAEEDARHKEAMDVYWRSLDGAVAKLDEVVREIDGKLQERQDTLARLSKEAEDKILRLATLMQQADAEVAKPKPSVRAAAAAAASQQAQGDGGRVVDMRSASAALVRRTHRRVYEAFDVGHPIHEIARETGLSVGEIELILALREKASDAGSRSTTA